MGHCGDCSGGISLASILGVLGEILDQLTILNGGLGITPNSETELTPLPVTSIFGATIGGSSGYNTGLTDTHNKKYVQVINYTDGDIWISLDGGNSDHFEVKAGSSQTLNIGALGTFYAGDIDIRRDESTVPTAGNVLISAFY